MCDPLNIVFVIGHLAPGGTREICETLARTLVAQHHNVRIAALYKGPCDSIGEAHALSPLARLTYGSYMRSMTRLLFFLKRSKAHAVVCFLPVGNVSGALAAKLLGVKSRIATQHSPAYAQQKLLKRLDKILAFANVYTDVVCVSESVRASFSNYLPGYKNKLIVIENGIDDVHQGQETTSLRQGIGIPDGAVLFCMIGRLSEEKNVRIAVQAMSRLPRGCLLLVGDGPLRGELEATINAKGLQERVSLVGAVGHQMAMEYLRACDVFVQISRYEGRSVAVLEAIAVGRPILSSDIPSQREVLTLEDGTVAAELCDGSDPEDVALKMAYLAENKDVRCSLQAKLCGLAACGGSARMAERYASLIKSRF